MSEEEFDANLSALKSLVMVFYGVLLCVIGVVASVFIYTHEGDYARITTEKFVLKESGKQIVGGEIFVAGDDMITCTATIDAGHKSKECKISHKKS